jgi:hypothetical protein
VSFERQVKRLAREFGRSDGVATAIAADFLTGGSPTAAEIYDRKGVRLATFARFDGEAFTAFRERIREGARAHSGAARVKIGGLARGSSAGFPAPPESLPRSAVVLADIPPHTSQLEALELIAARRPVALVAGRRWGKTTLLVMLAIDAALAGKSVGVFSPTYKFLGPLYEPIVAALHILPNTSINRALGEIRLDGGGAIDLWSLDHTARAGRGRKYHLALIDESAHDEDRLADSFPSAIAPALLDYAGSVVAASTPNGLEGWFHEIVHDPRHGFVFHHAPTSANPHLPNEEIAALRATLRAEIASQELDALFLDTGGATIFPLATLLIDGEPHPDDFPCQAIGLAIDSNSGKGGPDRDGCAAVIFALIMPSIARGSFEGARVVLLDWDIQSLTQGGVAPWLSHMRDRAVAWFRRLKPLGGPPVAHIEPAGNGYAIIEAARAQGLNPQEIDTKYVTAGKDARALMVEPHSTAGRVKIGRSALERRSIYRGAAANHLVRQVTGFRAFDKDAYRREDDLFDAAIYAALITLGDGTEARWSRLKRVA